MTNDDLDDMCCELVRDNQWSYDQVWWRLRFYTDADGTQATIGRCLHDGYIRFCDAGCCLVPTERLVV